MLSQNAFCWQNLAGQNLPGHNIREIAELTADQCKTRCNEEPRCLSYSWSNRSLSRRTSLCEIKDSIPMGITAPAYTSGIKDDDYVQNGECYISADYRVLNSPNRVDCLDLCLGDVECRAYTWVSRPGAQNTCHLKNRTYYEVTESPLCVSGYIHLRARVAPAGPPQVLTGLRHVFVLGPSSRQDPGHSIVASELVTAFRARGHQVHRLDSVESNEYFLQIRRQIEAGIPYQSQVIVVTSNHGTPGRDGIAEDHNISLDNGYVGDRRFLTGTQLRTLAQLAQQRHVRFAMMDNSCHSGNTVLNLERFDVCATSRTTPNYISFTWDNNLLTELISDRNSHNLSDIAANFNSRPADNTESVAFSAMFQSGCAQNWINLREALANENLSLGGRRHYFSSRVLNGDFSNIELSTSGVRPSRECEDYETTSIVASQFLEALGTINSAAKEVVFSRIYPRLLNRFRSNANANRRQVPDGIPNFVGLLSRMRTLVTEFNGELNHQKAEILAFNAATTSRASDLAVRRNNILGIQNRMNAILLRLEPLISIAQAVDCASRDTPCSHIEL